MMHMGPDDDLSDILGEIFESAWDGAKSAFDAAAGFFEHNKNLLSRTSDILDPALDSLHVEVLDPIGDPHDPSPWLHPTPDPKVVEGEFPGTQVIFYPLTPEDLARAERERNDVSREDFSRRTRFSLWYRGLGLLALCVGGPLIAAVLIGKYHVWPALVVAPFFAATILLFGVEDWAYRWWTRRGKKTPVILSKATVPTSEAVPAWSEGSSPYRSAAFVTAAADIPRVSTARRSLALVLLACFQLYVAAVLGLNGSVLATSMTLLQFCLTTYLLCHRPKTDKPDLLLFATVLLQVAAGLVCLFGCAYGARFTAL